MHKYIIKYQTGGINTLSPISDSLLQINPFNSSLNNVKLKTNTPIQTPNQSFGDLFKNFINNDTVQGISNMLSGINTGSSNNDLSSSIKGGVKTLLNMTPWGTVLNAADNVLGTFTNMTGKTLDNITTGDKIISSIPIFGNIAALASQKTIDKNFDTSTVASDFSTKTETDASNLMNKNVTFGRNNINSQIENAWKKYLRKSEITDYNKRLLDNDISSELGNALMSKYTGNNQVLTLPTAKEGIKFPELEESRKFIRVWNKSRSPIKFQNGGKIKNIIVEGSLHARKHNLEEINPELKDNITSKGIPVISKENNKIIQQAEIEVGELILRKELTDKIEELYKNNSEESMIEAGKILSKELLTNTKDKTK